MNQSRVATTSDLRSTEPIRSRFNEDAVLKELSSLASEYVKPLFNRNNTEAIEIANGNVALYQNKEQYNAYEKDLFGNPVQANGERLDSARRQGHISTEEIQGSGSVGVEDTAQTDAEYFINTI